LIDIPHFAEYIYIILIDKMAIACGGDMALLLRKKFLAVFLILAMGLTYAGWAQEKKPTPTLERGIGQYKHENYEEALLTLKKAREEDPESSLAAYYLGLTYKQMQDYNEAIPHLKDAIVYTPKIQGALMELIDCCYQLNRLEEALRWIEEAESEGIRPSQVAFMKGLVLLKQDKDEDAIAAFKRAKEMDAAMSQASNYQIGLAYLKSKN
jgi:pentatricopeptide repeat protein